MKTITGVIVGALIVVVIILGVLSYQRNQNNSGSLIIGVTDATANISNVNDIDLSIKKVEVYSATKGWVSVSSSSKSYKLLALHTSGKTELYARSNVPVGTYDKIRVTLGDAVVKTKAKGDVKATLPSAYIVANTAVKVRENSDTSVKLDVLADQSLHSTVDGEYVFAPVVKTESRSNATVSIGSDDSVSVSGGDLDSSASVGVDIDGTSKANFHLNTDNSLKVESKVMGGVKFLLGGKTYEESDVSGESSGNTNTESSTKTDTSVKAGSSTDTKSGYGSGSVNVNLNGGVKTGQ